MNSAGTTNAEPINFTTPVIASSPTVVTTQATYVSISEAIVGGDVTSDNGASVTERGVCWGTSSNPTIADNKTISGTGTGSFSVKLSSLEKETTYYVRAYAINNEGLSYGETITFTTNGMITNGIIYAGFSVSETKKVYFSQGNLQYQASTGIWRFAENQYDVVGEENSNISSSYSGWIDLFGYGTSGYKKYYPYLTSTSSFDYVTYEVCSSISGTPYDWGQNNAISNGGNRAGIWRTLSQEEWEYLLFTRTNAPSKCGMANINGVEGIILLPDNWTLPNGLNFLSFNEADLKTGSSYRADITMNSYSASEWSKMENNGAVFFPSAGRRVGLEWQASWGYYWMSDLRQLHASEDTRSAATMTFDISQNKTASIRTRGVNAHCYSGCSVRLVQDAK